MLLDVIAVILGEFKDHLACIANVLSYHISTPIDSRAECLGHVICIVIFKEPEMKVKEEEPEEEEEVVQVEKPKKKKRKLVVHEQ